VPFCPNGKTVNPMPIMNNDDEIEVFALKKPVWSFKVIYFILKELQISINIY
jgi:hypothetical protein